MIKIEKNQIVPEHPDLRVLSSSGDYGDNDLIECSTLDNPDFALYAFPASFIRYGNIVNQFNNPLELGEALLKIDPDCTHDTAILFKEEEARRIKREGGDYTPENPVPTDENIEEASKKAEEEKVEDNTEEPTSSESTSTEEVPEAEVQTNESGSTDSSSSNENTPTEPVVEETASTPTPTETTPSESTPSEPVPTPVESSPSETVPAEQESSPEAPTPVEVLIDAVKTTLE